MSLNRTSFRLFTVFAAIALTLGTTSTPARAEMPNVPTKPDGIELFPISPDASFERHVVSTDGTDGTIAGTAERLIYSNTGGLYSARISPGFLLADDISVTAADGCTLSRFTFQVTGQGDPDLPAAPYGVSWALYDNCPGSWSAANRPQLIIDGTEGAVSFPDGAPRTIEFVPSEPVAIPTNFWLGLTFTGDNAGMVLGAPAFEGHSSDIIDFPGFACNATLGGFPDQPHASFNAEVFGIGCDPVQLAYKAQRASGTPYRGGRDNWFADDLNLVTDGCMMTGYEVAVKGSAGYYFELRDSCGGAAIPGTEAQGVVGADPPEVHLLRFSFDPPIALPESPWFAMRISNDTGGVVVAGRQADVGWTEDSFGIQLPDQTCEPGDLGYGIHDAFHVSITCDGAAPKGACCDMYVTDENGDAVCREVAEVNCPFPPPFTELRPKWIEGAACDPDPFSEGACGQAACCYKDELGDEYCSDLTENECYAIPPLENKRQWQRGRFCGLDGQDCPIVHCMARQGPCTEAHECSGLEGAGCQDPACCTLVCTTIPFQDFCCAVCWDAECAQVAQLYCASGACCDTTPGTGGVCEDDVAKVDCRGEFDIWTENMDCSEVECVAQSEGGACCNRAPGAGGACVDYVLEGDCVGWYRVWTEGVSCLEVTCSEVTGACCDRTPGTGGVCTDGVLEADCVGPDLLWLEEKLCSEITCTDMAGPPVFSLKAVKLNGSPITPANQVTVAPGDTIEAEIRILDWAYEIPGGVRSYQARIKGREGAVSGGDGTILPVGWNATLEPTACWQDPDVCGPDEICDGGIGKCVYPGHNPAMGAYLDQTRSDFMFFGLEVVEFLATSILDYWYGATLWEGTVLDSGTSVYAGTLKLVASDDACGIFTFGFVSTADTILGDEYNVPYLPELEPLFIHLEGCVLDACVARDGDCAGPHATAGCDDPDCCTLVCTDPEYDYCCSEGWDEQCAQFARAVCAFGACCDESPATGGTCEDYVLETGCAAEYAAWHEGARCDQIECERGFTPIPTTSEWGLVVMVLAILTAGKVYFGRFRPAPGA